MKSTGMSVGHLGGPVSRTAAKRIKRRPTWIAARYRAVGSLATGIMALALMSGCSTSSSSTPSVPSFTPPAGSYSSAQTVTITEATEGAVLHCTTDGSAPTSSSPLCSEPTTVAKTETLSAIASVPGGGSSAVAHAAYTINLPAAATPVISVPAGTYVAAQMVTISDTTVGASIYYTTDGSTPTSASTAYSVPLSVSATETITAIAIAPGYADSALASALLTVNLPAPAPAITPASGSFTGAQTVTITDAVAGATIYYTVTPAGTAPVVPGSTSTTYGGPITVSSSSTVVAVAIAPGLSLSAPSMATFQLAAITPVISPANGTFTSLQSVTITDATPGAAIFYTVTPAGSAPSTPTITSLRYSAPIAVLASETIEAIAIANSLDPSATATATFTVSLPPAATPIISPAGGTFNSAQAVTIVDATAGAAIYYTVDGSLPSATNGSVYTGQFTISSSETVQAVAVAYGYVNSPAATAGFALVTATPVISPTGGTFSLSAAPAVTITDATPGAAIFYTLDGTTPSMTNGQAYSSPIAVAATETIKAIAIESGFSASAVAMQSYTITLPTAATPVFSPAAGTFTSAQTVSITDSSAGVFIYYTLDGTAPSATHGTLYTGGISVSATETVEAIAIGSNFNNSLVAVAMYTLTQPAAATPVFSPAAGTFTSVQTVSITDTSSGVSIYYTLDGSTPSATHGTLYTGTAISVSKTETIKAIATGGGFNKSAVVTGLFTINLPAAETPVFSPAAGTFTSAQTVSITDSSPGVSIYYTLDGSAPSATHGTLYTGTAISVASTETIEAIAIGGGFNNSPVATALFTITLPAAPTPVITPGTGTYMESQMVTITDSNSIATIYYTTDGSKPSATNGTRYLSTPITVSSPETLNAVAIVSGMSNSAVASAVYSFMAAPPTFSPAGGAFTSSATVTLSDTTPGVTIYFTVTAGTTGTTPTTASTPYTTPFTVSATDTVEAYAVATGYADSPVASSTFTLNVATGPAVFGNVTSGTSAIGGASVQLYAAGTAGYGSAPSAVGSAVVTDASGAFSIPYTCPAAPGDQMYVVATGGTITGGGASNAGLGLMTALGTCASLPTSSIVVNEVTTIASVYALAQFSARATGGGIQIGAPAPTTTCPAGAVGSSSCNYPGMVNAFKTVLNLVSVTGGTALSSTPAYPVANQLPYLNTSTAPQARVNTLASILSTCVRNAAGCATLFADVSGTIPVDSLQAAFAIAQNPGANVSTLYGLLPATPPYTPNLASLGFVLATPPAPVNLADFTLALTFTGGGLGVDPNNDQEDNLVNKAMAIDGTGNVWITANAALAGNYPPQSLAGNQGNGNLIVGISNLGAPLTPANVYDPSIMYVTQFGGYSAGNISQGVNLIAIDPANDLWLGVGSNNNGLVEVAVSPNSNGSPTLSLPALTGEASGSVGLPGQSSGTSLAFDQVGHLWASTRSRIFGEFSSAGAVVNSYSNPTLQQSGGQESFTFDSNGSLWSVDDGHGVVDLYAGGLTATQPSGSTVTASPVATFGNTLFLLAARPGGDMYACSADNTSVLVFNSGTLTGPVSQFDNVNPGCISPAVDGDGNFWSLGIANDGRPTVTEVTAGGIMFTPAGGYTETTAVEAPTNLYGGQIAIDGSGNLWLMNTNNFDPFTGVAGNALVEVVGVAAPTITPLAVATQNGLQGTRP